MDILEQSEKINFKIKQQWHNLEKNKKTTIWNFRILLSKGINYMNVLQIIKKLQWMNNSMTTSSNLINWNPSY